MNSWSKLYFFKIYNTTKNRFSREAYQESCLITQIDMTKTGCKRFGWLQNIWTCCNFSLNSYIENFILTSQMLMRVMITFSILSKLSPFFPPLTKQHGQNRMLNCEKRLEYWVPFIYLLHVWTLKIYKPWYHAKGTRMLLAWDNNTMQNPFWWILIATLYI